MIESITLQGFKSFAERVRLDFGPGITAVIGPNGSGKSNVVEAVRWATHQARARELRAGRATELIFHGSGGKAPLGLAEVQLELRTTQGQLSFSRRIYRDGSAEQDLSGQAVRVRDIHAALRGTGLGPGGLAVIGQGEVSSVVQAEGQVLLGYLQEAAGLSRAVAAREEAERRLQGAASTLAELERGEHDLARQLQRLAAEAQAAGHHRQLSLRELALTETLRRQRQDTLAAEWRAANEEAARLSLQSAGVAQQTQLAAARLEAARSVLTSLRADLAAHQQALELLAAAQEAERRVSRSLHHLQAERAQTEAELASLCESENQRLPEAPDPAPLQAGLDQTRTELARLEAQQHPLSAELVRARRLETEQAEALTRSQTQRGSLETEWTELSAALEHLTPELARARAELSAAAQQRQQSEQAAQVAALQRAELQGQLTRLGRELAECRAERSALQREHSRLETVLSSYTRYGEGPRQALLSGHPGLIGSVADLLSVESEYQVALTAALGRRTEQVVVRGEADAREIIEVLKRRGGRATFLPLDLLRVRPRRDAALLGQPGVLGNLAGLCPSDPPQISEALLADILLLEDLKSATRLARQFASRPRLVTLDGELIEPGGALTGGRLPGGGGGVLADQRRMQDLTDELAQLDAAAAQLAGQEEQLGRDLAARPAPLPAQSPGNADAVRAEREAERRVTQLDTALQAAQDRRRGVQSRLEALLAAPQRLSDVSLSDLEARLTDLDAALSTVRVREREQAEQLAHARDLTARRALAEAAAARQRAAQVRLAASTAALTEYLAQQRAADDEVTRRQQEVAHHRPAGLTDAEQRQQAASLEYANLLARQNKLRENFEAAQLLAARREGSLEALPEGALLPGSPREWNAELTRVRTDLAGLGPVNALAETEHTEQATRLGQMQAERQDAAAAAQTLTEHLAELARGEDAATSAAFRRVGAAFTEYSRELLGGEGELDAERGEDGRLRGLRLQVQPRGKRTRSMALLSAGERTMAGLGFLFALNHAHPDSAPSDHPAPGVASGLPLAVLDEVDAPLDEANIRRFTHFLEVFAARGAQFVLVTHQKATMEVAQVIWGVTTDQSGASRVLSIRQGESG
ncbi:chromosome segregation SMC family protein [Deinococcus rubellus]|uniref:Chromosome partition protein Smc n=1 Tax=Deinococcus rubellus TaxID=1889240 RepID=A0ABY5YFI0_9DEIO|nr:chromosome segregation SMC family protein [Deinococcus rubellus]UWX63054.1 chromosome segregation protein SMC [Deinococcus rubellus]